VTRAERLLQIVQELMTTLFKGAVIATYRKADFTAIHGV
jgi:hypothetical protein